MGRAGLEPQRPCPRPELLPFSSGWTGLEKENIFHRYLAVLCASPDSSSFPAPGADAPLPSSVPFKFLVQPRMISGAWINLSPEFGVLPCHLRLLGCPLLLSKCGVVVSQRGWGWGSVQSCLKSMLYSWLAGGPL